jgi:outer membrane protein assembly factor BamB
LRSRAAQLDGTRAQANQTSNAANSDVAIEQANAQRTSVYPTGPTIQKGEIALESSKLFVIKRGSYESYPGRLLSTGPNRIYMMGGDYFWPYHGVGYSDPIVSGGVIYFSVNIGDGHLFALDAHTGERKWHSKREKGSYSPPVVMGDTLYVGADDGNFYAVDLNTNRQKWRHTRDDQSTVMNSPAVEDGLVYYSANGTLYALDAEAGDVKWKVETTADYLSTLAIGDGCVYFAAADYIFAVDSKSGKEKWNAVLKERGLWSPLVVAHGLIYFRNSEGHIRTVNNKTGELQPKPDNDAKAGTRLAIDEDTIYFGGWQSGTTYAIDATTRETKWKFWPGMECRAPVVAGETVYLVCEDGKLYALDATTGKRRWTTSSKKPQLSSPVVTKDAIYFISDDGKVYAVR